MPRSRSINPTALTSKTVYLQRIQEAVIDGYRHYALGSVPLEKTLGLVREFKDKWGPPPFILTAKAGQELF